VPTIDRLTATDEVLSGYVTQYAVMAEHAIPPSEFERRLELVKPEDTVCGFVILGHGSGQGDGRLTMFTPPARCSARPSALPGRPRPQTLSTSFRAVLNHADSCLRSDGGGRLMTS